MEKKTIMQKKNNETKKVINDHQIGKWNKNQFALLLIENRENYHDDDDKVFQNCVQIEICFFLQSQWIYFFLFYSIQI